MVRAVDMHTNTTLGKLIHTYGKPISHAPTHDHGLMCYVLRCTRGVAMHLAPAVSQVSASLCGNNQSINSIKPNSSINQSTSKPVHQPINQPTNQPTNPTTNPVQPNPILPYPTQSPSNQINQSNNKSTNQSIQLNQSSNHSADQADNPFNQSGISMNRVTTRPTNTQAHHDTRHEQQVQQSEPSQAWNRELFY
jgi:hypothetical protein